MAAELATRLNDAQRHRAERLQQLLVDLAAHFFHDRERLGMGEFKPVGALFHQGRIDVDDGRQAHDVADLIALKRFG